MKRSTIWTTAAATAALLVMPVTGAAQGDPQQPPAPPQTQTGTTDTTSAQAGQADAQEARRRLTDARNTLSELTQLPQATQLTGDARTQVSQLIANFNELITTQANWRASFAKVEANLDALIGPETAATGTATGTTGTGTTGTAGTSGAGMPDLAPEVREKLVELRTKLNEFEAAAGGGEPSTTPDPSAPGMTGTPATEDPHASHAQTPAGQDAEEILRHIEAIEAILDANDPAATTGTSGTIPPATPPTTPPTGAATAKTGEPITLSPAQVAQLRLHLTQLRGLIER